MLIMKHRYIALLCLGLFALGIAIIVIFQNETSINTVLNNLFRYADENLTESEDQTVQNFFNIDIGNIFLDQIDDPFDVSLPENTTPIFNRNRLFEFSDYSLLVEVPNDWENNVEFEVEQGKTPTEFILKNIRLNPSFKAEVDNCLTRVSTDRSTCVDEIGRIYEINPDKLKAEIDLIEQYPITSTSSDVIISKGTVDLKNNDSSEIIIQFPEKPNGETIKIGFNTLTLSTLVTGNLIDKTFVLYGDGITPSKLRSYNPSVNLWGTENVTEDSVSSSHRFEKICRSPNRNESIYVSEVVANGVQLVQIFNGTQVESNLSIQSNIGNANVRYIDCGYDNESVGYVVVHNSTTQLHFMKYDSLNKAWINISAPNSCGSGTTISNVKLTSTTDQKRFILQCTTVVNSNISFQVFNGTGWQTPVFVSNMTDTSGFKTPNDCSWDPLSGNFYCFFNNGTGGNFSVIKNDQTNAWTKLGSYGITNRSGYSVAYVKSEASPRGRWIMLALALNNSATNTNGSIVSYMFDTNTETISFGTGREFFNGATSPTTTIHLGSRSASSMEPMEISWKYMAANNSNGSGASCVGNNDVKCFEQGFLSWTNGSIFVLTFSTIITRNGTNNEGDTTWGWTGVGPGLLPYLVISTLTSGTGDEFVVNVAHDTYINEEDNQGGRKIGMMCLQDRVQDLNCFAFNESLTFATSELETSLSSAIIPSSSVSFMRLDNLTPAYDKMFDNFTGAKTLPSGYQVRLGATLIDNYRLDTCILETNETGSWENKTGTLKRLNRTAVLQNCTFVWENASITNARTIGWRINFNDTQSCLNSNNPTCGRGSTPVMSFDVQTEGPTNSCTPTNGQNWTLNCADNCNILRKEIDVDWLFESGTGLIMVDSSNITYRNRASVNTCTWAWNGTYIEAGKVL